MKRARSLYAVAIFLTVLLGLSTREFTQFYPEFVILHFGDALWAAMVYFGLRFLIPGKPLIKSALMAIFFSFAIEISQLYQAGWINSIRATTVGALIFGQGYLPIDFLRYTIGVICAYSVDLLIVRFRKGGNG